MGNPIENLGDYNKVRKDLQAAGGRIEVLYKNIEDTAVSKATPKLMFKGGVVVASLVGITCIGYKGIRFMKCRKQKIENEPALKKEFVDIVEANTSESNNKELTDDNGMF